MNTKTKVIIATTCAAVLVGSALSFKKIKAGVTKIIKAEEPEDEEDRKAKFDSTNEYVGDSCEAEACDCAARRQRRAESMSAIEPCCDSAVMGKTRLVD